MTPPASAAPRRDHPAAIAWIDAPAPVGRWGHPDALAVPLSDRGLLLADGIFETMLVLDGRPRLLAEHLARWRAGATLLQMDPPPEAGRVEDLIRQAIARSGIASGALRLNWSRGTPAAPGARGIAIPPGCRHHFWLQLSPANPCFEPLRMIVSPTETRRATRQLSRGKSVAYGSAIQARRQAAAAGADDALLASSAGGLCCGTSANLLVRGDGDTWLTPPEASGCLAGVMRAKALELGLARETVIEVADLAASGGALLLNSLGCRPISHLETKPLIWASVAARTRAREAERLWQRLRAS